jgi:hypothetical protein
MNKKKRDKNMACSPFFFVVPTANASTEATEAERRKIAWEMGLGTSVCSEMPEIMEKAPYLPGAKRSLSPKKSKDMMPVEVIVGGIEMAG